MLYFFCEFAIKYLTERVSFPEMLHNMGPLNRHICHDAVLLRYAAPGALPVAAAHLDNAVTPPEHALAALYLRLFLPRTSCS